MRLASTLLAHKGGTRVGLDHGALMVRSTDGTKTRVPLESVDGVLLVGGASMITEAIARCISTGVRVSSLTRSGRVRFVCQPATAGNVHLRVAQLRRADDEAASLQLARWIVAGKLANSLRLIRRWASDEPEPLTFRLDQAADGVRLNLERVAEAPTADHLRGVEGNDARWHFVAMGHVLHRLGSPFTMLRRSRRPPGDPLNAAISFGYGILTAELSVQRTPSASIPRSAFCTASALGDRPWRSTSWRRCGPGSLIGSSSGPCVGVSCDSSTSSRRREVGGT